MFTRVWAKDMAERSVKTFAEVFLALIVAGGTLAVDMPTIKAAALSAAAAAISVVVSALSLLRGSPDSASLVE